MTAACKAPRCAHLLEVAVGSGAVVSQCLKGQAIQPACPWHRTPAQMAAGAAREQAMLAAAKQPMNRRPIS